VGFLVMGTEGPRARLLGEKKREGKKRRGGVTVGALGRPNSLVIYIFNNAVCPIVVWVGRGS